MCVECGGFMYISKRSKWRGSAEPQTGGLGGERREVGAAG